MELNFEIAKQFFEHYFKHYQDISDLDDFKQKYIQDKYPFKQEYYDLGLKNMENTEMVDKPFEVGFIAREVIHEINQKRCNEYIYTKMLILEQENERLKSMKL